MCSNRDNVFIQFCIFSPCHQGHINQHILGKDAVAGGGGVDQHVGDGSHQLAVLNDGGADRRVVKKGQQNLTEI